MDSDSNMVDSIYRADRVTVLKCLVMIGFVGIGGCTIAYLNYLSQQGLKMDQCFSDMKTAKHQLDVEILFTKNIETVISDAEKLHEADREQFRYAMENCFAKTPNSIIGRDEQNEFQPKCNKAHSDYERASKELKKLKSSINLR